MGFKIEIPPTLTGAGEQQLRQVYSYLYRLAENLNVALNAMEGSAQETAEAAAVAAVKRETASGNSYNELRALIVNTATVIQREMDVLETTLRSEYVAQSEFGEFQENIDTTIRATAEAVVLSFGYDAAIDAVDTALDDYILHTEGYIKQGFIDYDDEGLPIIGIAIGQNLSSASVTVDGESYEQLDGTQSCAFYTSDRVSFRINGQEVAYVSNSKLYIGDVEITGKVELGKKWQMSTTKGFAIKWIGG